MSSAEGIIEFAIEVQGEKVEARLTRPGHSSRRSPAETINLDQSTQDRLKRQSAALKDGNLDSKQIEDLGKELYKVVFVGEVEKYFEEAVREIMPGSRGRVLRVVIDVDPYSIAADWPLEFAYHSKIEFLATYRQIALYRRVRVRKETDDKSKEWPERKPLRVLVVVSLPRKLRGTEPVALLNELEALAARRKGLRQELEVRVLGQLAAARPSTEGVKYLNQPASYENLSPLLPDWEATQDAADVVPWKPHVLHFVGHGTKEPGVNTLVLIKDGRPDPCNMSDLGRALDRQWPRVVVLQACEGAVQETASAFMGLVEELVQQDIQALVVTQARFADNHAGRFAAGFYEALLNGANLDEAVQQGRKQVAGKLRPLPHDFGAPVLFTYEPVGFFEPPPDADSRRLIGGGAAGGVMETPRGGQEKVAKDHAGVVIRCLDKASEELSNPHRSPTVFKNHLKTALAYGSTFPELKRLLDPEFLGPLIADEMDAEQVESVRNYLKTARDYVESAQALKGTEPDRMPKQLGLMRPPTSVAQQPPQGRGGDDVAQEKLPRSSEWSR